ncbi:MAG TPA: thiamine phosphate synthase [Flavobacteriales bacterium]|nr:thiamine phosphate synthase [Flavobacteriales bacterium]
MKVIVLSTSKKYDDEEQIVSEMFKQGLQYFHLRKPNFSKSAMMNYLDAIPKKYHNRIVLHSKHSLAKTYNVKGIHLTKKHRQRVLRTWWQIKQIKSNKPNLIITTSFHSLETITGNKNNYNYVFLSPVFDSISKKNYQGKFNDSNLKLVLDNLKTKVIALGGVDITTIKEVQEMGFDGMGFLGGIWKSTNPLAQFINVKKECERRNLSLA